MPRMTLEPTTPVFERAKTFRILDRAANLRFYNLTFSFASIFERMTFVHVHLVVDLRPAALRQKKNKNKRLLKCKSFKK
jgi:hypothetical protein